MTGEDKEELEYVSLTLEESIDYTEKTLQNAINKAVEHRVIEASALFLYFTNSLEYMRPCLNIR